MKRYIISPSATRDLNAIADYFLEHNCKYYRISKDETKIPLYYGEMKIKGDKYHVIPRTKPSR